MEEAESAWAKTADTSCQVTSLEGGGRGVLIAAAPNTNLLYGSTRIPAVRYQITPGTTRLVTRVATTCK